MEKQTHKLSLTPKFFFISLGVLITLITSVSSYLILLFEVLNKKFPDVLNATYVYGYNSYNFETLRASLATLIIFFPVFIFLSYLWNKESRRDLGHISVVIRKWMIYLILFVASLVIIIDLVTLVKYFVSGEITIRFIYKVLGALIIACLINFYYVLKMKKVNINNYETKQLSLIYGIVSILFFIFLIVWSFSIMGSPTKQRAWRLDEQRINTLQNIQSQVINYWQQKEKLPQNLVELSNPISGYSIPVDPEFEKGYSYEYKITDKLSFQLCATFSEDMPQGWQENNYNRIMSITDKSGIPNSIEPYSFGVNNSWVHGVGHTCFKRTIDTDIYPPYEINLK